MSGCLQYQSGIILSCFWVLTIPVRHNLVLFPGAYQSGIIFSSFWVLTCEAYATPFLHHWNFCLLIVTSIQLWAVAVVMGPFPLQSGQQTATARQRNIQSTAEVTSASNTTYRVPSKQQRSPPHQTQPIESQAKIWFTVHDISLAVWGGQETMNLKGLTPGSRRSAQSNVLTYSRFKRGKL